MSILHHIQVIKDAAGHPAFAVVPYAEFLATYAAGKAVVPDEVVCAVADGETPMKAWRMYLGLTQGELAGRMGVTPASIAQMERARTPRRETVLKVT